MNQNETPLLPSMLTTGPLRRHCAIVKIEADSIEELATAFRSIASELQRGGMRHQSISGGPSFSWIYQHHENPAQTHDAYFEEINAYLERLRAQRTSDEEIPAEAGA